MPGTDFFDDDLVQQRDRANRIKLGPADEPSELPAESGSLSSSPKQVADLNLTRMAKHRRDVDTQAAQALQELEKLRSRQEKIEGEKRHLEDLRRRHDDYDRGKREMTEHLQRSLVLLERQEVEAQRMAELYNATRSRFHEMLQTVESLNEEAWPEGQIRDELNKALGLIEQVRVAYNKDMARIDAARTDIGDAAPSAGGRPSAVLFNEPAEREERDFGHWVKVGAAVSLPLVITLVVILVIVIAARINGIL